MKRATLEWVKTLIGAGSVFTAEARDILDSDARQRAEIRDLKARLKYLQAATQWLDLDRRRAAFNLANKGWRKA